MCRYAAEAEDRFLAWFALAAHAETGTITRLCESLGLGPRHTRGLLDQPGADDRLTVVYRHLLLAGRTYLTAGRSPRASCPACVRCAAAADRALDIPLTGLREERIRERYRDLGGLCVRHVRAAAGLGGRRWAAWLAQTALSRLAARPPGMEVLAGAPDADAPVRARRARLQGTASAASHQGQMLAQRAFRLQSAAPLGTHARLPRPLRHQKPPLLRPPRGPQGLATPPAPPNPPPRSQDARHGHRPGMGWARLAHHRRRTPRALRWRPRPRPRASSRRPRRSMHRLIGGRRTRSP